MPWIDQVSGVLEAWFAGSSGDKALANILFGDVNPSGKLPITFPKSEADLPHPTINKPDPAVQPHGPDAWRQTLEGIPAFQTKYDEGLKVGYKWYDAEKKPVIFPFGYGLSYTTFSHTDVYAARAAFVTGTFAGVVPVRSVDGRTIGDGRRGPMVERLQALYRELVDADVSARGAP